jgi:hypothetical protein
MGDSDLGSETGTRRVLCANINRVPVSVPVGRPRPQRGSESGSASRLLRPTSSWVSGIRVAGIPSLHSPLHRFTAWSGRPKVGHKFSARSSCSPFGNHWSIWHMRPPANRSMSKPAQRPDQPQQLGHARCRRARWGLTRRPLRCTEPDPCSGPPLPARLVRSTRR